MIPPYAHKTFWILDCDTEQQVDYSQVILNPRVKTSAAYVRVRCYTPARVSNFVKDFLAGAYD